MKKMAVNLPHSMGLAMMEMHARLKMPVVEGPAQARRSPAMMGTPALKPIVLPPQDAESLSYWQGRPVMMVTTARGPHLVMQKANVHWVPAWTATMEIPVQTTPVMRLLAALTLPIAVPFVMMGKPAPSEIHA